MQKLKFINTKNVEIDFTSGHYGVTDWSGLSNTSLDVQSQQTPFSDGSIYLDALLENREISVTVAMNDENDMSKRYEYRRELISALNPKLGEGYLIYVNDFLSKRIKCVPQLPIIPNKNSDENGTLKISCSFTCCNPYWEDLEETTEIIKNNERAFIVNRGDIPAQIKAKILTSYAKNPRLVNFTTDKKLGLSGVINKDVFINTNQGEKEVYSENIVYQLNLFTPINSVAYSETQGKFVAVGEYGTILNSTDGINWEVATNESDSDLNSVIYSESQGKFVSVGNAGTILNSTDGINWTSVTSGTSYHLNSVIYSESQGKFVSVGEYGTILNSTDGINWTSVTSGTSSDLNSVIYSESQGKFVAVGNRGTILNSTDGINWEVATKVTTSDLNSVIYSELQSKFVAVGISEETEILTPNILQSFNGDLWEPINTSYLQLIDSIIYSEAQEKFVAVGYFGTLYQSKDGKEWEDISFERYYYYSDIAYSAELNIFVLVTDMYFLKWWSKDCKNWQVSQSSFTSNSIIYSESQGKFVSVGEYGHIEISPDGINWTSATNESDSDLNSVIYSESQGKFVSVGNAGTILNSTDGINWTSVTSGTSYHLNSVIYSESQGKFVSVGEYGTILNSTDGINWTSVTSGTSSDLNSVIYSESQSKFVAVGNRGTILNSTDGINWTGSKQLSGILKKALEVKGIIYIVGSFIINSKNDTEKQENLINRVTTDSDVNLNLDIGENELALIKSGGNASVKLTFRNKYIGL